MSDRSRGRRRALGLATAVGALTLYAVGAAISGHLSLIARRPILDGVGPPPPNDYVNPPPSLRQFSKDQSNPSALIEYVMLATPPKKTSP